MRPMISLITVGLVALGSAQVIEERSIVRNPDGSQTHNARSSYSQASFTEESTGPDGTTIGRSVQRDTTGKITGNEWTAKNGQKLQTKPIDGSDIGARSTLGGFGGIGGLGGAGGLGGSNFGPHFGNTGFGNTGFGGPIGSGVGGGLGTAGLGGVGPGGVGGGIGTPGFGAGYGGFPSGGLPWANFGNFGGQFGQKSLTPSMGHIPQFDFHQFGFQQPLSVPNYSKFLLGGVGFNPNIANDGHFANFAPKFGIDPGFSGMGGGFGGGFGNPGFGQRSYKHEVDPATGKQSYSFSESSGHSTSSRTGQ